MKRYALVGFAVFLACAASGARAQEPASDTETAACAGFDWPLLREQAWFSASGLPRVASGGTLSPEMPGAVLALKPMAQADLPFAPSREPKPGTYGGVLRVPAIVTPGLYQVTLSEGAWIDVSQDDRTTRPAAAHTMRPGCPTIRKSVRFQLGSAPVVIVVSGAKADTIKIAVAPAE